MHPNSGRRIATRMSTSHALLATTLAAGLSFIPLADARAQHDSHHGHQGTRSEKLPVAKKAPIARHGSKAGVRHAGHDAAASDTPAVAEFKAAHAGMMRGMDVPYTGDPDADFRIQMIPHHQGAIDMARVAMRRAKDPWSRQLAESIIIEQQREIAEMRAWLAQRGIADLQAGQPQHIITASSYRQHNEEAGTRDESRGQSWAPGSGVPATK